MKLYGPYKGKDSRERVVIVYDDGTKRTKSYPRFIIEQSIGRELSSDETVDHIDGDKTNNTLANLQILSLADNIRKSAKPAELIDCTCLRCGKHFTKPARVIRRNQTKLGKKGPFCSNRCVGLTYH